MQARCSVAQIDQVVQGALWRERRAQDFLAWHAMNTGHFKEGTQITDLLQRDPTTLDRLTPPTDEEAPAEEVSEKAAATLAKIELAKTAAAAARAGKAQG